MVPLSICLGISCTQTQSDQTEPAKVDNSGPAEPLVLINTSIYTVNPKQPWAKAVAIQDGKILAVGAKKEVMKRAGSNARVLDLKGRLVMPGFQDTHLHALEAGMNEKQFYFPPKASLASYERLARKCAKQQRGASWVLGAGVSVIDLLEREELPVDVLDRAVPDRPALILDDLGHGA